MNYPGAKAAVILLPLGAAVLIALNTRAKEPVQDVLTPLPAHSIQFEGGLEDCLQTSLTLPWTTGTANTSAPGCLGLRRAIAPNETGSTPRSEDLC